MMKHSKLCLAKRWPEKPASFRQLMLDSVQKFEGYTKNQKLPEEGVELDRHAVREAILQLVRSSRNTRFDAIELKKVAWFLVFRRTSCANERFLKLVALAWSKLGKHVGMSVLKATAVVKAFAPVGRSVLMPGGVPGPFLLLLNSLWVEFRGHRCWISKKKDSDEADPAADAEEKNKKKARKGTKASALQQQKQAVVMMRQVAGRTGRGNKASLLGVPLRKLRYQLPDGGLRDLLPDKAFDKGGCIQTYDSGKTFPRKVFAARVAGGACPLIKY